VKDALEDFAQNAHNRTFLNTRIAKALSGADSWASRFTRERFLAELSAPAKYLTEAVDRMREKLVGEIDFPKTPRRRVRHGQEFGESMDADRYLARDPMAWARSVRVETPRRTISIGVNLSVIASGEQSADAVRETCRRMWTTPMAGSGWKVVIVNEVDRMSAAAETIWLDRLENLPQRTVIVMTTNYPRKLSARLRDRCVRVGFESSYKRLAIPARDLLVAVWKAEMRRRPDPAVIDGIVRDAVLDGQVSLRRAVQLLGAALIEGKRP